MPNELPADAQTGKGVKLSDWVCDPDGPYCSMRIVEGTDPGLIANRVAFIEKTPRVRVRPLTNEREDFRNWHPGYKGDGGWDKQSQGWADQQLLALGYDVPNPLPYTEQA